MTTTQSVPPPGPGVQPPFAAPPTDGNRKRLWIGLGIGGAVLLLCCVGGIGGFIALAVSSSTARINQARTVVTKYLVAWQQQNYAGAYELVCDPIKEQETLDEFAGELSGHPIAAYTVAKPELTTDTTLVPVTVNFVDGTSETSRYDVVLDSSGASLVCGSQP